MKHYDTIIIGDGIAARAFLWSLSRREKFSNSKVLQISAPELIRPCTLNSTSLVSLFGMRKGLSELGDTLVEAYTYTSWLFERFSPIGVFKAKHFHLSSGEDDEKFQKRFGLQQKLVLPEGKESKGAINNCFLIDPQQLMGWLNSQMKLLLEKREGLVLQTYWNDDKRIVELLGGDKVSAEKVLLCTGAGTSLLFPKIKPLSKIVPGSYLVFDDCDRGDENWVISLKGHNLTYRAWAKQLLIGATSKAGGELLVDRKDLRDIYFLFEKIYDLPNFEDAKVLTGVRQKGQKRRPFWGEIDNGLYGLYSLYKNGFTSAFLGAEKLTESW